MTALTATKQRATPEVVLGVIRSAEAAGVEGASVADISRTLGCRERSVQVALLRLESHGAARKVGHRWVATGQPSKRPQRTVELMTIPDWAPWRDCVTACWRDAAGRIHIEYQP